MRRIIQACPELCRRALAALFCAALCAIPAFASEGVAWDSFPTDKLTDKAALQNGAKLFVNHCLNCHGASFVRYNRLKELGLSEAQIKKNLVFAPETKVGDTMKTTLDTKSAKEWFGAAPPDLTLVARSRADAAKGSGADYLYTYLRGYYRDPGKATGWDNVAFPSVAMPNVLWELQGERRPVYESIKDPHDAAKQIQVFKGWEPVATGSLSTAEFDNQMSDLVAFMSWVAEPDQKLRVRIGVWALIALALLALIAWRLNAAYWRDVR
jgi:ubiquinol-cytochrome c reductase cytochrome c1 subunit